MNTCHASRRLFLRHAGALCALARPGGRAAGAEPGGARRRLGAGRAGLQGAGLPVPVRRQRRLQHGAAHRHRVVGQLQRGAQPGAGLDRAAGAGHRAERRRGGGLAGSAWAACCRSLPANCAGPHLRAAPADGQPADDVRHRQAPGHPAQHRPAGHADHQGAVRPERAPAAGQPVLAQRPAEHLAGAGARRRHARLGRAHGRHAGVDERQAGVHRRSRPPAMRCGWPGRFVQQYQVSTRRRHPHGHRQQRPRLRLGRCRRGDAAHRLGHARQPCLRARPGRVGQALDRCRDGAAHARSSRPAMPLFGTAPAQRQLQRQQRPEAAVRQPADRREVLQRAGAAAADRGAHDRRQQRRRRAGASARCSSSAWAASTRTTCRTATTPT